MTGADETAAAPQLRLLSLNCWGLKFLAAQRTQRLSAIADWIGSSHGLDAVALQEIWTEEDYTVVSSRAKDAGLLYSRYFYSGAIGSGLAILSAYPILDSFVFPYTLSGYPLHFIEGDWFAAKAACGITIDVPRIGKVDVLNSHMYAPGGEGEGLDGAHRVAQAWELARLVNEKAERGRHVVVMGDLNSQPHSLIIRLLLSHGCLTDAFVQTHPPPPSISSHEHRSLTSVEVLHQHGITCDSPLNTYSAPKLANKSPNDDVIVRGGKRLDYILFRPSTSSDSAHIVAESLEVVLTDPIPGLGYSYSDHFGLIAVLSFLSSPSTVPIASPPAPLAEEDLSIALHNLSQSYRASLVSSKTQLQILALTLLFTPALAIAASFQPLRYIGWLFVLLGVATGSVGATMLYTGFVGGQWEAGATRNIIAEMENELARLR